MRDDGPVRRDWNAINTYAYHVRHIRSPIGGYSERTGSARNVDGCFIEEWSVLTKGEEVKRILVKKTDAPITYSPDTGSTG